jgi:hypothetical protein
MKYVEPFTDFLARTTAAQAEQFVDAIRAAAERWGLSAKQVAADFERMKAHILRYYGGVAPVHSFLDNASRPVDCVPFEQQPTVRAARAAGLPVVVAAPKPACFAGARPSKPSTESVHPSLCPVGTVPLLRVTLERMIACGTLENFFRKGRAEEPAPSAQEPES